jgi:hypothetical protein
MSSKRMQMTTDERAAALDQIIETSTELKFAVGNDRRMELLSLELTRLCMLWIAVGSLQL